METPESIQALQKHVRDARRHLEWGDRDRALALLDAALAVGEERPSAGAVREQPSVSHPDVPPTPDPPKGLSRLEQIARQRRIDRCVAVVSTSLANRQLADARPALEEIRDLDLAHPDISRVEVNIDAARPREGTHRIWVWATAVVVLSLILFALSRSYPLVAPISSGTRDFALAPPAANELPDPAISELPGPAIPMSEPPVASNPAPIASSETTPSIASGEPAVAQPSASPAPPVAPQAAVPDQKPSIAPARPAAARAGPTDPPAARAAVSDPPPVAIAPRSQSVDLPAVIAPRSRPVDPPAVTIAPRSQSAEPPAAAMPSVEPRPAESAPAAALSASNALSSTPAVPAAVPPPAVVAGVVPDRSAADDDRQIRQVLEKYRAAYERLDARSARQVWPRVDEAALGRAFEGLASQRVTFAGCDVDVRGPLATAQCSGTARYVTKVGNQEPRIEARSWTFLLRRIGPEWKIEQARAGR